RDAPRGEITLPCELALDGFDVGAAHPHGERARGRRRGERARAQGKYREGGDEAPHDNQCTRRRQYPLTSPSPSMPSSVVPSASVRGTNLQARLSVPSS